MKHVNHDSAGNEYRIYSSIPGCDCAYCQSQRAEARRNYSITSAKIDTTAEEAGQLLDQYARTLMKLDDKKSYSTAIREAFATYPMVAELYTGYSMDSGDPNANVDRTPEKTGNELDVLAKETQRTTGLPYLDAVKEVLREHPGLAERYDEISQGATRRKLK